MPFWVDGVTVRVSADVVVEGLGLNAPVVPVGRPLTENVTGELNPFVGFTVTV